MSRKVRPRKKLRRVPFYRRRIFILLGAMIAAGSLAFVLCEHFSPPEGSWLATLTRHSSAQAETLPGAHYMLGSKDTAAMPAVAQVSSPLNSQLPCVQGERYLDLEQVIAKHCTTPNLKAGVFAVEPQSGRYVEHDAYRAFSAASMIKLPVFVRLLQALDSGKLKQDMQLVIRQDLKGGGSGCLQWRPCGTKISLKETAQLMMTHSDNTATNMIIDVLGGKELLNEAFTGWGLKHTSLQNPLPDLAGTNTTSPYDLVLLLAKVNNHQLISDESRKFMMETMEKNRTRTLLPMGMPPGTIIAHKTGDIGTLVGDSGIVTTKDNHQYIVSVAVERSWNDRRANALIRQISKDLYLGITGDEAGIKLLEEQASKQPVSRSAHRKKRHRAKHR